MIKYFQDFCFKAALVARNPVRWLIGTAIIAIVAIVIATAMAISGFRDHALASTQRELENTLVLLTRHFDQEFEELQRIQKNIDAHLHVMGTGSAEEFARRMASFETHKILKAMVSDTSTGTLNIISADGHLINRTDAWPAPEIYLGDRSYFLKLKENATDVDEEIIEPLVSRVSGGWLTTFARRLSGPNGEFLGVVSRHVNPEQFEQFFKSIFLGKSATISMLHRNRMLMARHPHANELIGTTFSPNGVFDNLERTAPSTLITTSPIDGVQRITSVWQLDKFPVVLVATVPVENALVQWRAQTQLIIVAAALAALIVGGLLFLTTRQVTRQHRAARKRLTLEMNRLDTAINNMSQGLMLFDASARAVVVSKSYLSMYRASADVIKPGCTLHDAMTQHKADGLFAGDVDMYCSRILKAIKASHSVTVNIPDGRVIQMQSEPIADGGWVVTHEDITDRHRVEERIAYLAHYDSLTDLPNRTLFRELLGKELGWIARGQGCAVLYIDMDEFKAINDSLGHSVGDALLRAVAQRLKSCVRSGDVVARLGGDEFAIVHIDFKSRDEIIDLVSRVYSALRAPFECLGHSLFTDASIGIAMAPRDGEDLDTLLKNADLAMYGAKADGRRTYRFFEPEMDARVQAQRLLEHDLRHASTDGGFEAGGFEVYYQPLLRLDDDAISGCEALLRWRHPVRGMISPVEFIPVAESIGVINQLGEWVLSTACAEAAAWPGDIKIAVNVSPVQFRSPTLALKVAAALESSGLSPRRLELEITEAVLIRDDDVALAILHQLRDLGVRIALDDFGTGYSSLSYLQRFPFDKIKIDRCFVTDIGAADGSSSIVQAVVSIAAARDMTTTAEGVETEQQKDILRALGCAEMQGWLFSAAKPATEVRALIEAHRARSLAA